jgi:Uma2 family endonuclease
MNATIPASMTIAEFDALPEREDGIKFELHEGEVVEVTFPNTIHIDLQDRLKELLKPLANKGRVFTELPFQISTKSRPTKRCADVGCVDQDRWREALGTPVLEGAPELVVEVLSPSSSASELILGTRP